MVAKTQNTYTITQIKREKKNIWYTHSYTNWRHLQTTGHLHLHGLLFQLGLIRLRILETLVALFFCLAPHHWSTPPRTTMTTLSWIGVRDGSSMRLVRLKPRGPGPVGAWTDRYNENLQSRTRAALGLEMFREKICGFLKFLQSGISIRLAVLSELAHF